MNMNALIAVAYAKGNDKLAGDAPFTPGNDCDIVPYNEGDTYGSLLAMWRTQQEGDIEDITEPGGFWIIPKNHYEAVVYAGEPAGNDSAQYARINQMKETLNSLAQMDITSMDWIQFKEHAQKAAKEKGFAFIDLGNALALTFQNHSLTIKEDELTEYLADDQLAYDLENWQSYTKALTETKWEEGLLYDALHRVGDDPAKSSIEQDLAKEFKDRPEILNRIAAIFKYHTTNPHW